MNGLRQNAKRAARGLITATHFIAIAIAIAIAYRRMAKPKQLPPQPLVLAAPK